MEWSGVAVGGLGYIGWGLDGGGRAWYFVFVRGGGEVSGLGGGREKVGVRRVWWVMGKLDEGG